MRRTVSHTGLSGRWGGAVQFLIRALMPVLFLLYPRSDVCRLSTDLFTEPVDISVIGIKEIIHVGWHSSGLYVLPRLRKVQGMASAVRRLPRRESARVAPAGRAARDAKVVFYIAACCRGEAGAFVLVSAPV